MTWTRRYFFKRFILILAAAWLVPTVARADRKDELRDRFASRAVAIRAFKSSGTLGETTAGVIEAVNPAEANADPKLKSLIAEENADRKELYGLIAKDQGADVATVAKRAAMRNYEKALPGDWLKTAGGEWKKK